MAVSRGTVSRENNFFQAEVLGGAGILKGNEKYVYSKESGKINVVLYVRPTHLLL